MRVQAGSIVDRKNNGVIVFGYLVKRPLWVVTSTGRRNTRVKSTLPII